MIQWNTSISKRYVEERYGIPTSVQPISKSNNYVWKIMIGNAMFVIKEVIDQTVDVKGEQKIYNAIGKNTLFRPIYDILKKAIPVIKRWFIHI